jgi:hypothetical protein
MAMNEDEKESSSREHQDIRELENAFKLNIGNDIDKMLAVVTGNYRTPRLQGEPDKITKSIKDENYRTAQKLKRHYVQDGHDDRAGIRRSGEDERGESEGNSSESLDRYMSLLRREDSAPTGGSYSSGRFATIVNELERFRFSSDTERRERQIGIVVAAVRNALQTLIIREVGMNTKRAFREHVENVYTVPGGIKVAFNFAGDKHTVTARGAFSGEETVCVYKKGQQVYGGVVRLEGEENVDISGNYGIELGE